MVIFIYFCRVRGIYMDLYTLLISALQNKEAMELLRLGIIYIHLIACCVAIGLILTSDIAMIKQLLKGEGANSVANTWHI